LNLELTVSVSFRKGSVRVVVGDGKNTATTYGANKHVGRVIGGMCHKLIKDHEKSIKRDLVQS